MVEKIKKKGRERIDISGRVYGFLTVEAFTHVDPVTRRAYWLCLCQCGCKTIKDGATLRKGHAKSCGCLKKIAIRNSRNIKAAKHEKTNGTGDFSGFW